MSVDLVPLKTPILREKLQKFDFFNPPLAPTELYRMLGEKLIETNGVGLAANQVGMPYRFFVIRSDPIIGCFNPIIVDTSDEIEEMEEACLTFPGISVKVPRFKVIRVRYMDPVGEVHNRQFQDLTARVFQHELDHLDGTIITDHVSRLQLELAIKKARKKGFKYIIGDFA